MCPADATAMPSSLASVKIQNGVLFWYWLTYVGQEKRPTNQ